LVGAVGDGFVPAVVEGLEEAVFDFGGDVGVGLLDAVALLGARTRPRRLISGFRPRPRTELVVDGVGPASSDELGVPAQQAF